MEHRFGHSLNNFKKIAIILNIFSGQNGMKLEVNYKNKIEKNHKYVEIEQYSAEQLQSHWRNQSNKNYLKQMNMRIQHNKIYEI